MNYAISDVDIGIIAGYFFVVLFIGFTFSRKSNTGKDFFLAGRSLGWAAIGFSLFASNISSSTIIGLSGQAYRSGLSVSNYEWMAALLLVFMTIFFIPFFIRSKISTIPEFLEKRYSRFARRYVSMVTIILTIIVDTASSLFAGVLILQMFFPELVAWQTYMILTLLAGTYTATGGLKAVVFTDILQAVIILLGGSILLFAVLGQFDYSWTKAVASVPERHMSVIQPMDDETLPWLGTLIGVPILGFYYWSTTQIICQRILGARNINHARWGALLGGFLKLPVLFLLVVPGLFAAILFPDLQNSDLVFAEMVVRLLPPGVIGIVLAGLIAAIMSSLDSALNAASALITLDFIQPRRPELTPNQIGKIGRITTFSLMVIAALWAPIISNFDGIFDYLQIVLSFIVPPIVTVFLMGVLWSRGNAYAAKSTLLYGHLICVIAAVLYFTGYLSHIHFTIHAGMLTFICIGIYVIMSLQSAAPKMKNLEDLTWKFRIKEKSFGEITWYTDFRLLSIILVMLTCGLVFSFW
ncbi:MAG: sodium:solute symporter [Bacteroidota bacterium]